MPGHRGGGGDQGRGSTRTLGDSRRERDGDLGSREGRLGLLREARPKKPNVRT